MQQTIALREATIRKRETKFVESFPFYFVSPDLVRKFHSTIVIFLNFRYLYFQILYDYGIRFGGHTDLIEKWPSLKMKIFNLLNRGDVEECAEIGFDNDTISFLVLLRSLSMKKSFRSNVDKLINFSKVLLSLL